MIVFKIISVIFVLFGILMAFIISLLSRKNNNKPKQKKENYDFCILIPARYESLVIEDLLKSIKKQTFKIDFKDVYVIVESINDETVDICKKYNASYFVRKDLELKRKGYALDECVKYILKNNKHYDAYFIFDADNILDKNFIKNMIPIFDNGYDLAAGYRNCKNGNDSVIAASSALTFSLVNTVFNNRKNKETRNITFSGTGFFIRGSLIEKWEGYPFHSLTEDYELSLYATLNNLTTYYNTKSIFYDEQPTNFKATFNQRVRWIRGYFDVRREYQKKLFASLLKKDNNYGSKLDESFGIIPYIIIILGIFIWFIPLVISCIYNYILKNMSLFKKNIKEVLIFLFVIYLILFFMSLVILLLENKKININKKVKIKTLFYNPIFIISYVLCAIKALTSKEVGWTKIEHGIKKKTD